MPKRHTDFYRNYWALSLDLSISAFFAKHELQLQRQNLVWIILASLSANIMELVMKKYNRGVIITHKTKSAKISKDPFACVSTFLPLLR